VIRPTRIVICGQPFTVEWVEKSGTRLHEDDDGYWSLGNTVVAEQKLIVRTLQGEHQLRETVLHETIHAILRMTSQRDRFKPNEDHKDHPEEPVVNAVAAALLAVLRDNPDVTSWLAEELA
jgi:hypothetical protein